VTDLPPPPPQGPGYACLERLLTGAHRQWPASCDEPPEGGPEAQQAGVAAGATTASGDLSDVADARSSGRHKSLSDEALDGGAGLSGGDEEGRLWLVGDRISIADIVVTDLVSVAAATGGLGVLPAGGTGGGGGGWLCVHTVMAVVCSCELDVHAKMDVNMLKPC
jgi:hypothetical protein